MLKKSSLSQNKACEDYKAYKIDLGIDALRISQHELVRNELLSLITNKQDNAKLPNTIRI